MPSARSISYIGATDLGDGWFAFKPLSDKPWRIITDVYLDVATAHLDLDRDAGYEIWPSALTYSVEVKAAWWSPMLRFGARCNDGRVIPLRTLDQALRTPDAFAVTVDLRTGQEIHA